MTTYAPSRFSLDTELSASAPTDIAYRTVKVMGLDIFYREAGAADAPTLLLLHGFPSAGHMFRDLIPLLADLRR